MEWNSLPHSLWDRTRCTVRFRSALKTDLFFPHKGTSSALEELRDALYKLTTTTTSTELVLLAVLVQQCGMAPQQNISET